ncbi:TIGR02253 family HAD-type hydrolase [Candidatus Woesearchaeota archaeon]|nr:TIGR02253 family HAD-type hydrolase [Candidatus Woesearchaeota archaeon]
MIKSAIFDLDNTLIDFMTMKKHSCEAAISAMIGAGLNVKKEKAMKELFALYDKYGLEEKTIFQKFLKKVAKKVDYEVLASGIVAYRRVRAGFLEPYPHVSEVLFELKRRGIKLAIVSDAPRLKAWIRLVSMKINHLFDVVVTFDDTKEMKPSTKPFLVAFKKLKLKPQQCLMVGDRPERDIKGAKKLGMVTCFAKYGNPGAGSSEANYEIDDIKELLEIVE